MGVARDDAAHLIFATILTGKVSISRQKFNDKTQIPTITSPVSVRCSGIFRASTALSTLQRYAIAPLHTGSAISFIRRAASDGRSSGDASTLLATTCFRMPDFMPSAPTRRSHVAVRPSANSRRMGADWASASLGTAALYDTRWLER